MILRSRRDSRKNATFLLPESEPWNKATDEVREIAEKKLGRGSPATNGVQIAPVSMSQELGPHCTHFSYGRLRPTISRSEKARRSRILCVSLISELHDRKLPLLYRGRKLEKPHREKSIFAITRNCISLHTVLSLSEQGQWLLLPGFPMRAYGKRLESPSIYREAEKTGNVSEKIHFSLVSKRYIGAPQILTDRICRLSQSRVIACHTSVGIVWGVAMAGPTYPSACASAVSAFVFGSSVPRLRISR